jgi:hypothetical protein
MGVGDPIWFQLYGRAFNDFHADPVNAAVEHDFNAQTFAAARRMLSMLPDFLVVHFVTPDHQGHAYGIRSARYRASMRGFDQDLFEWLDRISPEWTVLVTSDHGAADSGTHGSDTTSQRRSPLFAYGPGIRNDVAAKRRLDQVELPGLFAALLGVDNAEQSRGVTPLEWVEVNGEQRHRWACNEVERLRRQLPSARSHDAALDHCAVLDEGHDYLREARALATEYDALLGTRQGVQSRRAWPWVLVALIAALALGTLLWGKQALTAAAILSVWLACSLLLTLYVERLPGNLPNVIRGILFALTNLLLLFGAFSVRRLASWFDTRATLALGVFPGWLLVSYSTNTQVEVYVVLIALTWLLANAGARGKALSERSANPTMRLTQTEKTIVAISLVTLALAGSRAGDVRVPFLASKPLAETGLAGFVLLLGLLWSWAITRGRGTRTELSSNKPKGNHFGQSWWSQLGAMALVLLSFVLQRLPIHWLGRAAWLATIVGAVLCSWRGRREIGFYFAVASYAWVSRDFEWFTLVASIVLAEVMGRACAATAPGGTPAIEYDVTVGRSPSQPASHQIAFWHVVHATFLFCLCTLLRIGLEGGLQLQTMDLTVGTFGGVAIPVWLTGVLLAYKFLVAEALTLVVFLRAFETRLRTRVLIGLGAAYLVRALSLLCMLFVCGNSYWTAFRVTADLPFAALALVGVVLAYGADSATFRPRDPAQCSPP